MGDEGANYVFAHWYTDSDCHELLVRFGIRSLLGGGRGQYLMDELKEYSAASYEVIMDEARVRYTAFPKEWKRDTGLALQSLLSTDPIRDITVKAMQEGIEERENDGGRSRMGM